MALERLERVQHFDATPQRVWQFFTDIENLNKFTPDFFQLEILSQECSDLYEGQTIRYNLRLYGFKFPWTTQITVVREPNTFTDVQARGPYQTFRHIHDFYEVEGGVLMIDRLDFDIGWGLPGLAVQKLVIRPLLDKIFDHRFKACAEMLANESERIA